DTPWRFLVSPNLSLVFAFFPPPVGLGRGAQVKADQGSRLSEAKPSSSETPLLPSTTGCPQRSGGTQTIGSPFSLLTFFLATCMDRTHGGHVCGDMVDGLN